MSIHHMNAKMLAAFKEDRKAITDTSVPTPAGVTILRPTHDHLGVVVALDDGNGGAYLIGDTIGSYWGDETPDYFA